MDKPPPRKRPLRPARRNVRLYHESDQRTGVRYPLALGLRYSVMRRGKAIRSGVGRTVDFSSSGLRFQAEAPLALTEGDDLKLFVDWPVALDEGPALQFIAWARVVRIRDLEVSAEFRAYEFRTRGTSRESPAS